MMRQDAVYERIVLPVEHCRITGGMLQSQVVVGWQTEDAVVTAVERHQLAEETVHQMYLNRMHFILANRLHSMACKYMLVWLKQVIDFEYRWRNVARHWIPEHVWGHIEVFVKDDGKVCILKA